MREKYGANSFAERKNDTTIRRLRRAFINPFNVILFVLGMISLVTDFFLVSNFARNATTAIIIFSMILISGVIRLIQELRAKNAAQQLDRLIHESITVKREGELIEIPAEELVVGDLVLLSAGDRVLADIRLTEVTDLFISHEPIWMEAMADAARLARQTRRRPTKMGEMGMFSGMMYCADCGSIMYQCRATGFRRDQEYYICSGYRKGKDVCGETHSIRTVILEELILDNLREIVSFARQHKERFVQMVMDMDLKERNKGLAKKKRTLSEAEKRIAELDNIFKRLYEDNISGKLTDERFRKLSQDYEDEQSGLKDQVLLLREEIEAVESKSANVDRFLSIVDRYTEIPELTPHILHEFVEKIVIYAATDPHSKVNRRQQVDIYYKGIGILEISKVFDTRHK